MKFWLTITLAAFLSLGSTDITGRFNKESGFSGRFPIVGGFGKGSSPPAAGALLLEDGSSNLLLEDGSSELCLEGGC